jgi:DNA-binding FrmR family transcriptional regulator
MNQNQKQALISLKKARTSIDKIITTIEEEKYCIDIIQQNLAAI